MHHLLEIARSPEAFARFSRRMSVGVAAGFVIVVTLLLMQAASAAR